jgi:Cu/Ag efflux protein CusF
MKVAAASAVQLTRTPESRYSMHSKWQRFAVTLGLASALFTAPVYAQTQSTAAPQTVSGTATMTAKIAAIDETNRIVTLQDAKGNMKDVQVGPEVKRFNELKVGDTVTFTYHESAALAIVPANSAAPATQSTPTMTRGTGEKPSGTISQTQVATVTVQGIDMATPSVTVKTQDGRIINMLVQNKDNLKGLKVGDVVQITYTQAMAVDVK